MNALRNVAAPPRPLLIQKINGPLVHLLPGRALALTDEELATGQVQSLIAGGLARVQQLGAPAGARKLSGHGSDRRPDKKKADS